MIVSKTFKNIECDCCGTLLQDEWNTEEEVLINAQNADWIEIEGKHYCPDCYSRDDKGRLVIDKSRRESL